MRKNIFSLIFILFIVGFVVFGNFLLVRGNLNDGLVGYWNFDNNGFDQTVNGNDAVMTDILFVSGRFGDGVYTNGVSSKVVVDSLIVANESYTVSLWVKNLGNPSTSFIWCGYSSSSPSFEGNNGGYSYYVNNNNNINSGSLTNSVWYNFVFSLGVWI